MPPVPGQSTGRRPGSGRTSHLDSRLRAVLETLDAAAVHRWCAAGLDALRRHQDEIDQLNVYPVPDGDTGTNLVLTVSAAYQELAAGRAAGAEPTASGGTLTRLGDELRRMAGGALHGA